MIFEKLLLISGFYKSTKRQLPSSPRSYILLEKNTLCRIFSKAEYSAFDS